MTTWIFLEEEAEVKEETTSKIEEVEVDKPFTTTLMMNIEEAMADHKEEA